MITHRILLVSACPSNEERLALDRDDRAIRECLRRSPNHRQFAITTCPAATVDDFRRGLLDWPGEHDGTQRIVHFAGHGSERGFVFVDESNVAYETDPAALCSELALHNVSVAIFAACYSAEAYLELNFRCCVVMSGEVADTSALEFSRGFYDGIAAGRPTHTAFKLGENNVRLHKGSLEVMLVEKGEVTLRSEATRAPSAAVSPKRRPVPTSPEVGRLFEAASHALIAGNPETAVRLVEKALEHAPAHPRGSLLLAAALLARDEAFNLSRSLARDIESRLQHARGDADTADCACVLLAAFKYEYYLRNQVAETSPKFEELMAAARSRPALSAADAQIASCMRLSALTRHRLAGLFVPRRSERRS